LNKKQKNRYELCLLFSNNNIDLKIVQETIKNLFQFDLDIAWNYLWLCCEKDTSALLLLLWKVRGAMPPISCVPACRYQQSLSRCITCEDACVQRARHMRQNAYYRNLKWTLEDLLPCYCYTISGVQRGGKRGDGPEYPRQRVHPES